MTTVINEEINRLQAKINSLQKIDKIVTFVQVRNKMDLNYMNSVPNTIDKQMCRHEIVYCLKYILKKDITYKMITSITKTDHACCIHSIKAINDMIATNKKYAEDLTYFINGVECPF